MRHIEHLAVKRDDAGIVRFGKGIEDAPGSGLIQVTAYGILPPLTEGQRVAAPLRLHAASGFRNPGTYDYAAHLAREGIYVVGFSYPVVPQGQARIRIQVSAVHTDEQLDRAVEAFTRVGQRLKVI